MIKSNLKIKIQFVSMYLHACAYFNIKLNTLETMKVPNRNMTKTFKHEKVLT